MTGGPASCDDASLADASEGVGHCCVPQIHVPCVQVHALHPLPGGGPAQPASTDPASLCPSLASAPFGAPPPSGAPRPSGAPPPSSAPPPSAPAHDTAEQDPGGTALVGAVDDVPHSSAQAMRCRCRDGDVRRPRSPRRTAAPVARAPARRVVHRCPARRPLRRACRADGAPTRSAPALDRPGEGRNASSGARKSANADLMVVYQALRPPGAARGRRSGPRGPAYQSLLTSNQPLGPGDQRLGSRDKERGRPNRACMGRRGALQRASRGLGSAEDAPCTRSEVLPPARRSLQWAEGAVGPPTGVLRRARAGLPPRNQARRSTRDPHRSAGAWLPRDVRGRSWPSARRASSTGPGGACGALQRSAHLESSNTQIGGRVGPWETQ